MHFPELQQLHTPRLLLRKLTMADAPLYYSRIASPPEVSRYMLWNPHTRLSETEALIAFAKQAGYELLELEVASSNTSAIRLYDKLGFVVYGQRPCSLKLKDGTYYDELLMVLELN